MSAVISSNSSPAGTRRISLSASSCLSGYLCLIGSVALLSRRRFRDPPEPGLRERKSPTTIRRSSQSHSTPWGEDGLRVIRGGYRNTLSNVAETVTLIRWSDAAGILGVETREILDLIAAGELEPVRQPDDLYVRREQVENLKARRL